MSENINAKLAAVPVDSCAAFLKADVGFFRDYGFAIEASGQKIGYDETRDFAVESMNRGQVPFTTYVELSAVKNGRAFQPAFIIILVR